MYIVLTAAMFSARERCRYILLDHIDIMSYIHIYSQIHTHNTDISLQINREVIYPITFRGYLPRNYYIVEEKLLSDFKICVISSSRESSKERSC